MTATLDTYAPPDGCRPFLATIAERHLAELLAPCATCKGQQRGCDGSAARSGARHSHPGRAGEVIHGVMHDTDPRRPHHHHDDRCKPCPDCDKPRRHDMGPRLVFADYLEEQGDPWGEFVRVGVEMASDAIRCSRCSRCSGVVFDSELLCCQCKGYGVINAHRPLEARHDELLARHGAAWARAVLGGVWPDHVVKADRVFSASIAGYPNVATIGWHAGLPADFTLPSLDAWMGERCVWCNGEGRRISGYPVGSLNKCDQCKTTGRVNALAPLLLAAAPVRAEGLRFAGKRPWEGDGVWVWWADRPAEGEVLLPRHRLPDEFGLTYKRFLTEAAAHDALARAAIRLFRPAEAVPASPPVRAAAT